MARSLQMNRLLPVSSFTSKYMWQCLCTIIKLLKPPDGENLVLLLVLHNGTDKLEYKYVVISWRPQTTSCTVLPWLGYLTRRTFSLFDAHFSNTVSKVKYIAMVLPRHGTNYYMKGFRIDTLLKSYDIIWLLWHPTRRLQWYSTHLFDSRAFRSSWNGYSRLNAVTKAMSLSVYIPFLCLRMLPVTHN